ncbi:MAG: tetratricopeptide repeat protein [Alphaproteobacteria bacterium]|nr:tetratricopeptide repeat protein [Alphaproteobacteria bacterium]
MTRRLYSTEPRARHKLRRRMTPLDTLLAEAAARQRAGAGDAALALYDRVLSLQPGHVGALHASGVVLMALGRAAEGEARLSRAAAAEPGHAAIANDLAAAFRLLGRLDEARDGFRRATQLDATYAEAWHNLGLVELVRGDAAAARPALERAIERAPGIALTQLALGVACGRLGDHEAAVQALREATRLDPATPRGWTNLALALAELGRGPAALDAARRALALAPRDVDVLLALGIAANAAGEISLAAGTLRRVVAERPGQADGWTALSIALRESGDSAGAVEAGHRALALAPAAVDAIAHLARAQLAARDPVAALATLAQAPPGQASHPALLFASGQAAQLVGDIPGAVAAYAALATSRPCWPAGISSLLFMLVADDASPASRIAAAAGDWARACAPVAAPRPRPRGPRAGDALRVGYVSPDYRRHSVAFFLRPLLAAHDGARVMPFLYSTGTQRDDFTAWFSAHPGAAWRDIAATDDATAAARIAADGIDVLVDLAGHTDGNRLGIFARRPAPVQATWLGWPATTGLDAIDWRLTDAIADPPGVEADYAERLLRLADGFHVWRAPAEAPAISRSRGSHPPTFGSFNQALKLSRATIALWARVLAATPGSRLMIKCGSLAVPQAAARLREAFAAAGVAPDRLAIVDARLPLAEHFALYERVDVALDPVPYNGTTTTLEALWMGVPVVTRAGGDRHAARVGHSLLTHAGMPEFIAADDAAYVAIASALIADPNGRFAQRPAVRDRLAASPLCDGPGFARKIESAFEWMAAS